MGVNLSGDFDLLCINGMSCKIGKFGVAYIKLYVGPISPFEEQDQTINIIQEVLIVYITYSYSDVL